MKRVQNFLLIAGLGILPTVAWASERKEADIACKPMDQQLIYNCVIALKGKKSGKPIQGAQFTVGADMPSMPGAHNVKPTAVEPTDEIGKYRTKLHLEMTGEWVLRLDFTKPDRDRVVKKLHFGGTMQGNGHSQHMGSGEKTDPSMQKGDEKMKHRQQKH